MKRGLQGRYITISTVGETVKAFIPSPLPPVPAIQWTVELQAKCDTALVWLGRLDAVCTLLPDPDLFLYTYVRKEAVLSSMIEGTQSSLSDLLLYEINETPGVPMDDAREVSNYVAAMEHGLARLAGGLPLSLRLIKEMHAKLLAGGRGDNSTPGEFRRSQNWIGGSRPGNAAFVPPPPDQIMPCMGDLERFLHDLPVPTSALIKAALAHVQFETIHPFPDGNGQLGRLLITLILCEQEILREPLLYLSLYLKKHRSRYYALLNDIRAEGNWEQWLDLFFEAVAQTAQQAVNTVRLLMELQAKDVQSIEALGRISSSARRVHASLAERPVATIRLLSQRSRLNVVTVGKCLLGLKELGIVKELTGHRRNRVFTYHTYLDILNQGVE